MSNKLTDVSFDGKSGRYVSFTMCRTIWTSISVNYSFVPEKIYIKEINQQAFEQMLKMQMRYNSAIFKQKININQIDEKKTKQNQSYLEHEEEILLCLWLIRFQRRMQNKLRVTGNMSACALKLDFRKSFSQVKVNKSAFQNYS